MPGANSGNKEPRSFTTIELADVVPGDEPLILDSSVKGDEAQQVLTTNVTHSAPVYDTSRKSIDYCSIIVREVTARARRAKQTLLAEAEDTAPLEIKSSVSLLTDLSGRNPCVCLPANTLLKDAMLTLAKGTHRLMITETGRGECRREQIRGMLTQLSAIRYLYREGLLEHENVMNMSMADLKLAHSKVTPRGLEWKTTSAIDALRTLDERGQDSLPLVENNELVSTLEWSDFEPLFTGHDYRQYQLTTLHELKLKAWQHEDVAVMAKTASSMASAAKTDASVKQRYALRPVVPPTRRSLERTSSSAALASPSSMTSNASSTSIGVSAVVTSKKGHTREASFSANKLSEEDLRAALGRVLAPASPSGNAGSFSFLPPVRGASSSPLPSSGSNASSSPPLSIAIASSAATSSSTSGSTQSPAGSPNTSPRARGRRLARKPTNASSSGLSPPQSPQPQPAHLPNPNGAPLGSPVTTTPGGGGSALSLWKSATMSAAAAAAAATNNGTLSPMTSTSSSSLLSANSSSTPVHGRSRANSGAKPLSRPSSRPASPTRTPGTPSTASSNGTPSNSHHHGRTPSLLPSMQSSSSAATLSVSSDSIMSPPQRRSLGPSSSTASSGSSDERKRSRRTDSSSGNGLLDADAFFKLAKEKIDAVHRKRLAAVYITPQTTLSTVIDRLIAAQQLRSLWVVSSEDKLTVIGSVGPTEILQILVSLYTRTGPAILNTPPVSPNHVVVLPAMATGTPGGNSFAPNGPITIPPLFPKNPVTITVSQHTAAR